ncbi:MAG: pyridoxal-phosphate dependent enzyme [Cyclobacteriaceae bacterium]|nr:pyridoxal-phosphate dependent enzyme [Cyclobacteriaceae bacterium]
MKTVPSKEEILSAHERIKPYIHRTPVISSAGINEQAGCKIYFKCENFQKIGAFKARGAMNAALSLSKEDLAKGLATHSSGNHAQALARAAKLLGVPAYVVMPSTAPEVKKRGVKGFEGKIFECEPTLAARESTLAEVIAKTGATEIHPFNNYDVMAGQATATIELLEETGKLDYLLVPVGGGGLLSGTLLAAKYFSPDTQVIAGEPEGADDTYRSLQSGNIEPSQAKSVADGLLTSLGDKTFPIIREHLKEVITVNDHEIIAAMRLVWERMKIIIEPSCAVPLAAVFKDKKKFANKPVGVILSGGNVDLERACDLFIKYK